MKKSTQRYLRLSFLIIPLAVIVFLFGTYFYIANSTRQQLYEQLSETLGVPVDVGPVSLSPVSGTGSIGGFYVRNPSGYERNYALLVKHLRVKLNYSESTADTVVVDQLFVNYPRINWETTAAGNNYKDLSKLLEGRKDWPGPRVEIRQLRIDNGLLQVVSSRFEEPIEVKLPAMNMSSLNGTSGELAKKILQDFQSHVEQAVMDSPEIKAALLKQIK